MKSNQLARILLLNIIAVLIFLSWIYPATQTAWLVLESELFYFFNDFFTKTKLRANFLALINHRAFDVIAFLAMSAIFYYFFRQKDKKGKQKMIVMGIVMLLCGVLLKQITNQIPIFSSSTTIALENSIKISSLTSIPTKDSSTSSFPGDHGLMLMIFSAFMLRYFGLTTFLLSAAITFIFTLPRIMIGAHWFSDIYVGSLCIALISLSWFLLTSASDRVIHAIYCIFPKKTL